MRQFGTFLMLEGKVAEIRVDDGGHVSRRGVWVRERILCGEEVE